jgi:serine/threonine protein kinase/tetratricopeptide (TPR) repeat protein
LVLNSVSLCNETSINAFSLRSLDDLNSTFVDFEIRRCVGRGGMGAVYEAWQKSLGRTVAIKLLPPELMQSCDFFERFQREAQVMARLEHSNIARVYDTGVTANGEAYFVMELITGEPITTYVAAKRLTIRERLELFVQVCAGVQHAHQKGIIHRDLKPSNILVAEVDGRAVPKVIDFGLAKPLEEQKADETIWLSAAQCMGTPAYMSPEQVQGGEIDSRADIYSLGMLLYELLAGTTPVERHFSGLLPDQSEPRAQANAAVRPSVVLTRSSASATRERLGFLSNCGPPIYWPETLAREVQGDLDAIVIKALEPDPASRYQTVAALPEEIERYFKNEPVLAVDPSPAYLIGKFCRRHRPGLIVSSLFLALLVAGIGLVLWQSVNTRKAERLAAARLREGEQLIEFMLGDLQARLETVGRLDVLESAVRQVERFYEQPPSEKLPPESLFNRARARLQLGRIRNTQGKDDLAKLHYEESIRSLTAAVNARPELIAWQEELGQAWNSLAIFHHGREHPVQAEQAYRQALSWADRILRVAPNRAEAIDFKASVLHNFAAYSEMMGRLDDAEHGYIEALRLWQGLEIKAPDNADLLSHLSNLYLSLAFLHGKRGETDPARQCNLKALQIRERLLQLNPRNATASELLADIQQNIGEFHFSHGELAEAETWMDRYRPIREQLAERDPSNAVWKYRLAEAWHNYALLQEAKKEWSRALEAHRKSWESFERPPVQPLAEKGLAMWRSDLESADVILRRLAGEAETTREPVAGRNAWQALVEIRARFAAADPTNGLHRLALGSACLELARANLELHEDQLAREQTHLALAFFAKCFALRTDVFLNPNQLKPLRLFSGLKIDAANLTAAQDTRGYKLEQGDISGLSGSLAMAALGRNSIQWPPALKEELRRQIETHL